MTDFKDYGERFHGSFPGISPFDRVFDRVDETDGHLIYREGTATTRFDIVILQRGYTGASTEVSFDADTPLLIEWDDVRPEDVVEGSTATLRLISETDREFTGLYTVDPLGVILEVRRHAAAASQSGYGEAVTVWRGSLEPELYEEPYSTPEGYTVELTFADFAPMEREEFALKHFPDFAAIVSAGLCATAVGDDWLTEISTEVRENSAVAGRPLRLADLRISADNFRDEDGEAMTLREAVETILRPLGIHMRQHGGRAVLYDWNALASTPEEETKATVWTSTDQTLGVAEVSHAVTLNFSTYASGEMATGEIEPDDLTASGEGRTVWIGAAPNILNPGADALEGFRVGTVRSYDASKFPRGLDTCGNTLFKIDPAFSGSAKAGVLGRVRLENDSALTSSLLVEDLYHEPGAIDTDYSAPPRIPAVPVLTLTTPAVALRDTFRLSLKVTLELLADARNNPYEEPAENWNESGDAARLKEWATFAYIPCALEGLNGAGNVIAHYVNRHVMLSKDLRAEGEWQAGSASPGDMFLAWYDWKDRRKSSGWGNGWAVNRQCIGCYTKGLPARYEKRGDGEFVPLWAIRENDILSGVAAFRLTVFQGFHWFDEHRIQGGHDVAGLLNWFLYGKAAMEIVRNDNRDIDTDDVVYTASAIEGAASPVEIDIKAGPAVACPAARAVVTGPALSRGGHSGDMLQLLCNTLVSQYDRPHLLLKGEHRADIVLDPSGVPVLTDAAQGSEKRFIVTAAAVDCRAGTADVTLREISPDSYHPVIKA